MAIERFEDIVGWQRARELTNLIYEVTSGETFKRDFELTRQIRSAAGSTMHNIAEGFDSGSDLEFTRFLKYARRSASEVQSQCYLALDQKYISQAEFQQIYAKAVEVKKLINAFITYPKKSKK